MNIYALYTMESEKLEEVTDRNILKILSKLNNPGIPCND